MKPGLFRVSVLLLLAAFVVLSACAHSDPPPPIPEVKLDGLYSEVRDAVVAARDQAVAQPNDGPASGHLGMVLQANTLYVPAEVAYQRAVRLAPKEFAWHYYLALTLEQLLKTQESLDAITAALRIRPDYSPAILKRGDLLFKLKRLDESSQDFESVLAKDPRSAAALYGLAQVKYVQEQLPAAEDLYRRACEAYPRYGSAYYGWAVIQKRLGNDAAAAKNFELAERFKNQGPDPADPVAKEMLDLAAGPETLITRADQLLLEGKFEKAAILYLSVLKTNPDDAGGLYGLLNLLGKAAPTNLPAAIDVDALYARAARIAPQDPTLLRYYGAALLHQGKPDAATTALNKSIKLKPDSVEPYLLLGDIAEQANRPLDAMDHYRHALTVQPSSREAHLKLGRVLVLAGRDREAIPELLPAVQVDDNSTPLAMMYLAQAYTRTGEPAKAVDYLQQAYSRAQRSGQTDLLPDIEQGLRQLTSSR